MLESHLNYFVFTGVEIRQGQVNLRPPSVKCKARNCNVQESFRNKSLDDILVLTYREAIKYYKHGDTYLVLNNYMMMTKLSNYIWIFRLGIKNPGWVYILGLFIFFTFKSSKIRG